MAGSMRSLLVIGLALLLTISAASASTASTPCPHQITEILTSEGYRSCQQATSPSSAWVFTQANTVAISKSDACLTSLRALIAVDFDACIATMNGGSVRVAIEKTQLHQLASSSSATTRSLRRVSRVLTEKMSFEDKYLYIGIIACLALMLFCCLMGRIGCCCIPIPICC